MSCMRMHEAIVAFSQYYCTMVVAAADIDNLGLAEGRLVAFRETDQPQLAEQTARSGFFDTTL